MRRKTNRRSPLRRHLLSAAVAASALAGPTAATAFDCKAALVLALDVSRSVDKRERALQANGLAAALTSPDVKAAILSPPGAGVMAAAFVWSSWDQQVLVADWSRLDSSAAIDRFAARIATEGARTAGRATAVGEALAFASALHRRNPERCAAEIIDVSGDGIGNSGRSATMVRDSGALEDLLVNGLVIRGQSDAPMAYYRRNVIQGPGAFVIGIGGYADYADAMERKLLRELSPAAVRLAPADAGDRG